MTREESAHLFNNLLKRQKPENSGNQAQMLLEALHETMNDPSVIRLTAYTITPPEKEAA